MLANNPRKKDHVVVLIEGGSSTRKAIHANPSRTVDAKRIITISPQNQRATNSVCNLAGRRVSTYLFLNSNVDTLINISCTYFWFTLLNRESCGKNLFTAHAMFFCSQHFKIFA